MSPSELEVVESSVVGQQHHDGRPFPAVRECRSAGISLDDACAWIAARKGELVAEASRSGTVFFRGFPLRTPEDFDRFVTAFHLPNFAYEDSLSNAVRINKTPRVFTANEAPPDVTIYFHHEMAQTPIYPSKLFFFCEQPSVTGGATPLCRSDVLWERLVERCPRFAKDCETKGLRYSNVMPAANDPASGMGRSWQSTLRAQTPQEAEDRLRGLGYSWTWQDDGCLRATTPVLRAVYDLGDGRKSFFNQLIAAFCGWKDTRNDPSKAITFGDGTPLDKEAVMTAVALAEELAFDVPWQQGDVALVDNYVVMHGRRTFTGTRKVLASLVAA
jgi:hypothetical protein